MKLLNQEIPLEKFEIGFSEELLKSPQIKSKLVTIVRFLSKISDEIAHYESSWPDAQTIRLRVCRTYEDAEYLTDLRNQISDYLEGIDARVERYISTALSQSKVMPDNPILWDELWSTVRKYQRTKTKGLRLLRRAAREKINNMKDDYRGWEDEVIDDQSFFRGRVNNVYTN